ncbi:MAG: S8 family serine peptidase, partial [Nanoarchaeota archaeon]
MNTFKILAILVILSAVAFTVSALSQEQLANQLSKLTKNSESKINIQDIIKSAKIQTPQISQETKDIALNEVMQKLEESNEVPILVWVKANEDLESIIKNLEGFEVKYIYDQLNGFSGTATREAINNLIEDERVDYIVFDQIVKANLIQSRPLIQANVVESNYSLTGQGVGVCHLDTGIDYNHVNLAGAYAGGYDFVNNDPDPMDDNGHGTATAGVIASNHTTRRGISPKVNLLAIKVLDSTGWGYFSGIAAGINWCVTNKNLYNISVISMSLGTVGLTYTPSTSPGYIDPALQAAYNLNIASVASSGNEGSTTEMSYPAVSPYVISVG